MTCRLISALLWTSVIVASLCGTKSAAQSFTVVGNTLPPFSIEERGKLNGYSVSLLEHILQKHYGTTISIDRLPVPFARALTKPQNNPNTIAVNIACSTERKDKLQLVGPYYIIDMALIGRTGDDQNYTNFSDVSLADVAAVRDTLVKEIVVDKGYPEQQLMVLSDPMQAFRMLERGRVDLIAHIPSVLNYMVYGSADSPRSIMETKYQLQSGSFYFAFSNDFPASDIQALQAILADTIKSPEGRELLKKYGLRSPFFACQQTC